MITGARRDQKLGYASTRFTLHDARRHRQLLGLTLETVSRPFPRMQREGLIAAQQKEIELKDMARLREKVGHG